MQHNIKAALYMRLSKDDKSRNINLDKANSDSIKSQRMLLEQYAKNNGFHIVDSFIDDGIIGTTFKRPQFMTMMERIYAGEINCVLVKDLSRLGRDYIESGRYQEVVFPENNVRLIALGDNYDSDNEDGNDLTPLRNLFNNFYPRDISKKTRNALRARAQNGEYLGTCPYGYRKQPQDKHKLIPHEGTAPIVRHIFELAAGGYGYSLIARTLSQEKVLTPAAVKNWDNVSQYGAYNWYFSQVRQIVHNPIYLGRLVYGRQKKLNYKSEKIVRVDPANWITTESAHEPIIPQALWDTAHASLAAHSKPTNTGQPHIFSGLLRCSDCGAPMAKDNMNAFCCSQYKRLGKETCTNHRIRMDTLCKVVLADIRMLSQAAQMDKNAHIERLSGIATKKQQEKANALREELAQAEKRFNQLAPFLQKAFEEHFEGLMPDDVYRSLVEKFSTEKAEITDKVQGLKLQLQDLEQQTSTTCAFLSLVERYTNITELDRDILHELIDKVVVYQMVKEGKKKEQRIDIYYLLSLGWENLILSILATYGGLHKP
ncbi:recombinase family protein [Hydrogenoanaerobacterium sp.]|uniref:recombinase family protein n=1 Tax=Hydrogenoanaerobacterium sp. TaxID=2953763 RepID=UPI00289682F3|nr:recombinase family protein [Hydrogenoanaerobacterium sp.]